MMMFLVKNHKTKDMFSTADQPSDRIKSVRQMTQRLQSNMSRNKPVENNGRHSHIVIVRNRITKNTFLILVKY